MSEIRKNNTKSSVPILHKALRHHNIEQVFNTIHGNNRYLLRWWGSSVSIATWLWAG